MIGKPEPPRQSPVAPAPPAPSPRGKNQVLGCLAVVVLFGLALIVWLGGWWNQRRTGELAERARIHHLRRIGEDQLRGGMPQGTGAGHRASIVSPEEARAGEVLAARARELYAAGDWTGVVQCIGLLADLTDEDPQLGILLEKALFNRALQQLHQGQAVPALEYLQQLLSRTPTDREAADLRAIGMTIRDYGPDQRTTAALERFKARR